MRHDLTLRVPGYDIPAALELPDAPPTGAVLYIPGSLFSNVDGDYPSWNVFPRASAFLAEQMAERGLAVYRFAKLGPGTGSTETSPAEAKVLRSWRGRATIAHAALAHFRAELVARGLGTRKLVLAGHSEGAVVASVIARDVAVADGVVLLSGPSTGILSIMLEQSRATPAADANDATVSVLEQVVACIRTGEPIPDSLRAQAAGGFGAGALVSMPPEAIAYMRDCDATDPAALIGGYAKPVLIVQGGVDTSVPAHHAEALRAARGSRPTVYRFFPALSHMYKPVPPGTSPMDMFSLPGPTDPRVAAAIDNFVRTL
ncbi:MAG: alpha/beta hydrolase [Gemmatimonadales bacterium]